MVKFKFVLFKIKLSKSGLSRLCTSRVKALCFGLLDKLVMFAAILQNKQLCIQEVIFLVHVLETLKSGDYVEGANSFLNTLHAG